MTADDLTGTLRACAAGLYPLEAGTELLISNGTFLHRDDFTSRFITCGTSDGTPMAAIDWDAAITALANGDLPCSGGERATSSQLPIFHAGAAEIGVLTARLRRSSFEDQHNRENREVIQASLFRSFTARL